MTVTRWTKDNNGGYMPWVRTSKGLTIRRKPLISWGGVRFLA